MRAKAVHRIRRAVFHHASYRAQKREWNQMSRPQKEQFLLTAKNRSQAMSARVAELMNPPTKIEGAA